MYYLSIKVWLMFGTDDSYCGTKGTMSLRVLLIFLRCLRPEKLAKKHERWKDIS